MAYLASVIGVDRSGFKQTLRKVASGGLQVASTMAGALTGRGTVVIEGAGYRLLEPVRDETRGLIGSADKNAFVKVEAGRVHLLVLVGSNAMRRPSVFVLPFGPGRSGVNRKRSRATTWASSTFASRSRRLPAIVCCGPCPGARPLG